MCLQTRQTHSLSASCFYLPMVVRKLLVWDILLNRLITFFWRAGLGEFIKELRISKASGLWTRAWLTNWEPWNTTKREEKIFPGLASLKQPSCIPQRHRNTTQSTFVTLEIKRRCSDLLLSLKTWIIVEKNHTLSHISKWCCDLYHCALNSTTSQSVLCFVCHKSVRDNPVSIIRFEPLSFIIVLFFSLILAIFLLAVRFCRAPAHASKVASFWDEPSRDT